MATFILDGLNLNNATSYSVAVDPDFGDPKNRAQIQEYIDEHGGEIIQGSDNYDVVEHKIKVYVLGSSSETNNATLYANLSALQQKVLKKNVVFEFKADGVTNSSYADVLFTTVGGGFSFANWKQFIDNDKILVELILTCKPFWRGAQKTISTLYYSKSPAIILPGTVEGDVETPVVMTLSSSGTKAFGNKLVVGSRSGDKAITQGHFNPIKDFTGSIGTGFYSGEFKRAAGVNSWFDVSGSSNSENINDIDMVNANIGFMACDNGIILRTTNGGTSKTRYSSTATGTTNKLNKILANSSNVIYTVGNNGICLKSTNSGGSWISKNIGTADNIYGISFINSSVGWISGDNIIKRTTNGGTNWTNQAPDIDNFYNINFSSSNVGYFCAGNGRIAKSTNSGTNWINKNNSIAIFFYSIYVVNSSFVLVGGDFGSNGRIAKSTNSGTNWTNSTIGDIGLEIEMNSSNLGWVVGNNGTILKTTNAGSSWHSQTSNVSVNLNGISVVNSSVIFACGDAQVVTRTTDSGNTWKEPLATPVWSLANSSDYQDTYRAFARARNNSTNPDGVQMRASAGWAGGSVIASSAVSLANTTKQQWIDLGNISIPAVPLSSGVSATPIIKLEAKNGSTKSINFDTDVAVLVPQSGQVHYNSTTATSAKPITLDYDSEAVNKGYTIADYTGDAGIKLNPGTNNNIIALETKTYSTGTDGYNPVNVELNYFPRFLNPISAT